MNSSNHLTTEDKMLIEMRLANESKSVGAAYLLWFFLGVFGMHRFYLGDAKTGMIILGCNIAGVVMIFIPLLALMMFLIAAAINLHDLFMIPSLVRGRKERLRQNLADEARKMKFAGA